MNTLEARKKFTTAGAAVVVVAVAVVGIFFNACQGGQYWGARQAFLSYHAAVNRLDARAARSHMTDELARRFDLWLCRTAVLSDDMKMNILSAGLPRNPRFGCVTVRRDEALLTMTGETVGGQKVTGSVTMRRTNGDWRVNSQKWDVAGNVINL